MLDLGANVNHADVHNTTPLMDVIRLGCEARTLAELARFQRNGRAPLVDNQNCSQESALFRAIFMVIIIFETTCKRTIMSLVFYYYYYNFT